MNVLEFVLPEAVNKMAHWAESRPNITETVKAVIKSLVEINHRVLPIFIDGEMSLNELLGVDAKKLIVINGYLTDLDHEPLFALTDKSVRMLRFNSKEVWSLLPEKIRQGKKFFAREAKRLDMENLDENASNFYQGVIAKNGLFGRYVKSGYDKRSLYYINACTVFNKPLMLEESASSFFCTFRFKTLAFIELNEYQKQEVKRIGRPDISRITNEELGVLDYLMFGNSN